MKKLLFACIAVVFLGVNAQARWETAVVKEVQFFANGDVKALILRDRSSLNLTRTVNSNSPIFKEMVAALLTARAGDLKIKYERDGANFKNIIVGTSETLN